MRTAKCTCRSHSCRSAGVVHVLDVLGDLLGPVVRRGRIIVDGGRGLEREEE